MRLFTSAALFAFNLYHDSRSHSKYQLQNYFLHYFYYAYLLLCVIFQLQLIRLLCHYVLNKDCKFKKFDAVIYGVCVGSTVQKIFSYSGTPI